MKRIYQVGNMPGHVAAFAQQLGGQLSGLKDTEFWEAANIEEFEKNAHEIGYEICATADQETGRGFLVGFDVVDSEIISPDGTEYAQMKMYFIEITSTELKDWTAKMKLHREQQQDDYFLREELKKGGKSDQ